MRDMIALAAGAALAAAASLGGGAYDGEVRVAYRGRGADPEQPAYYGRSTKYRRGGSTKKTPAWYKGSSVAKRATRRGGNPAAHA